MNWFNNTSKWKSFQLNTFFFNILVSQIYILQHSVEKLHDAVKNEVMFQQQSKVNGWKQQILVSSLISLHLLSFSWLTDWLTGQGDGSCSSVGDCSNAVIIHQLNK